MTLKDIILSKNAAYQSLYNGVISAEIHKIDDATAQHVADLITSEANRVGMPIAALAACICQESKFDPGCYNKNLREHDGVDTFPGTDWGICQISGKYINGYAGMMNLTAAQMKVKALDPSWSIPQMANAMQLLLAWAEKIIPTLTAIQQSRVKSPLFLATLGYNRGRNGALTQVVDGQISLHPYEVCAFNAEFVTQLDPTPKPLPAPPAPMPVPVPVQPPSPVVPSPVPDDTAGEVGIVVGFLLFLLRLFGAKK